MAVLGSIWWGYWGRAAVLGSSMVAISRDARRNWGVPVTPETTQGGYWGIPAP